MKKRNFFRARGLNAVIQVNSELGNSVFFYVGTFKNEIIVID